MHLPRHLALLWASGLVGARSSATPSPSDAAVDLDLDQNTHTILPSSVLHLDHPTLDITVPCPEGACQEDDDAFKLLFHVDESVSADPIDGPESCTYFPVVLNGQHVTYSRQLENSEIIAGDRLSVTAKSSSSSDEHSLTVVAWSPCLPSNSSTSDSSTPDPVLEPIELAWLSIESIDGTLVSSPVQVNVRLLWDRNQVIASVSRPADQTSHDQVQDSSRAPVGHEDSSENFDDEVALLHGLQKELKELQSLVKQRSEVVKQQSRYVGSIWHVKKYQQAPQVLKECTNIKCSVEVAFRKTEDCLRSCYYRVFPNHRPQRPNLNGFRSQMQFPTNGEKSSSNDTKNCAYLPLPDSDSESNPDFDAELHQHAFFLALGAVASVFCLGCLTVCFRRRCCTPRARADRAARREERRTRRQYRCLARRKAFQEWWWRRLPFGRRQSGTNDYDEKRALILAQENVLEGVMQAEIRDLQREYGVPEGEGLSAAEEGRALTDLIPGVYRPRSITNNSNGTRSLPAYRSRAGSGRPPSYREIDTIASSSASTLVDGFVIYSPSGTGSVTNDTASDVTPDSSIADLSPRHSSETLRTDRSLF